MERNNPNGNDPFMTRYKLRILLRNGKKETRYEESNDREVQLQESFSGQDLRPADTAPHTHSSEKG